MTSSSSSHPVCTPDPGARVAYLLDIENLCGSGRPTSHQLSDALEAFERICTPSHNDFVFCAAAPTTSFHVKRLRPTYVVRSAIGKDGADRRLLELADPDFLARRVTRVVVGSGDGAFRDLAEHLSERGVQVDLMVGRGGVARDLSRIVRRFGGRCLRLSIPNRLTDRAVSYLAEFGKAVHRTLRESRAYDARDIVQHEISRLLPKIDEVIAAHPDAAAYGRARAKHALIDFSRREKSDRGEGSRAKVDADGTIRDGREIISFDDFVESTGREPERKGLSKGARSSFEDEFVEGLHRNDMLKGLIQSLSAIDQAILRMSFWDGLEDGEIAVKLNLTRETVNRRKNRSVRYIGDRLGPDSVE